MGTQFLLVATNDDLIADVGRLAAAAGIALQHARTVRAPAFDAWWTRASVVVLDPAAAAEAAALSMPHRSGVVVVASGELGGDQWAACWALGADRVIESTGRASAEIDSQLLELAGDRAAGRGRVDATSAAVAVIGAVGGAGGTVTAIAVSLALARAGHRPVLLDLDAVCPGVELAAGIETERGARWSDISAPGGHLDPDALRRALPTIGSMAGFVPVVGFGYADPDARQGGSDEAAGDTPDRGAGSTGAGPDAGGVAPHLLDTVTAAVAADGGTVVLDVPRSTEPAVTQALARAELTVMVTTADVRGCAGAVRSARRLRHIGANLGLVVRGPSPGGLGGDDIAVAATIPLIAAMRPEPRLATLLDAGRVPGDRPHSPLGRAADAVVAAFEAL